MRSKEMSDVPRLHCFTMLLFCARGGGVCVEL